MRSSIRLSYAKFISILTFEVIDIIVHCLKYADKSIQQFRKLAQKSKEITRSLPVYCEQNIYVNVNAVLSLLLSVIGGHKCKDRAQENK